ncbi:hypothetical protein DPX16_7512 [Anabarilius grahami]|uniref:Uncharacterized protein n=1 Tax=Anabarilius grahami TaxID=495550 RepID=A0A3N0ZB63_ANAGA|nr:hypothetical protein DPX16_7512 [Anabarilius grahami]
MDSKDARESLESGGGGARCRCSNGRRNSAAVLLIHSLLIAACAVLSLNIYLREQPGSSKQHDVGIYMQMIEIDSDELRFSTIWNHTVHLQDDKRVKLECAGPYTVYLWACMTKISTEAVVNLTMEQGIKSFHLQTLWGNECKEMQKEIMLSEKDDVTVYIKGYVKDTRKIRLFLGLHYMLGAQCFPNPLDPELLKQLGY